MSSRAGERPKRKTAVKAICRPVTAFCALVAIPIFPHRKTAHISRQRPAQGINQPRPAPSGVSRGIIICSGRWIGRRIALCQHPTRRSGQDHILFLWYMTHSKGHALFPSSTGIFSFYSPCFRPPKSRWYSRFCAISTVGKSVSPGIYNTIVVKVAQESRYSSTTTDPAIRSSSCFWSGESPRGWAGITVRVAESDI